MGRLRAYFSFLLLSAACLGGGYNAYRSWSRPFTGKLERIFSANDTPYRWAYTPLVTAALKRVPINRSLFYYSLEAARQQRSFVDYDYVVINYMRYPDPVYYLRNRDIDRADYIICRRGVITSLRRLLAMRRCLHRFREIHKTRHVVLLERK